MMKLICNILLSILVLPVFAAPGEQDYQRQIQQLHQAWAEVNFQLHEQAQRDGFDHLLNIADDLVKHHAASAESWLLRGLINSSYSESIGGLAMLKRAKLARQDLEKSLQLNDKALRGMAYYCLGNLYHQVPGWPISFGSDKTAEVLYEKALQMEPASSVAHYYYAQYLYDNKQFEQARSHFLQVKAHTEQGINLEELHHFQMTHQKLAKLEQKSSR